MSCDNQYGTFGFSCIIQDVGYIKSFWIQPTLDNLGAENKFANVEAVTKAAVDALIQAANTAPDTALYPLGFEFDNLSDERNDTVYQVLDSGKQIKIRKGKRTLSAIVPKIHAQVIEQLNKQGSGISLYPINDKGQLLYQTDANDVEVKPWRVQPESFDSKEIPGTASEAPAVMITLTFDDKFDASKVRILPEVDGFDPSSNIDVPVLIETKVNIISVSVTEMVLDIKSVDGNPLQGLLQGDWIIRNLTDAADETILTYAESEVDLGRYTLTYAAVDVSDILSPRLDKAGFFTYNSNKEQQAAV